MSYKSKMKRQATHDPNGGQTKRTAIEPSAIIHNPEPEIPPLHVPERTYPRDVVQANKLKSLDSSKHSVFVKLHGKKVPVRSKALLKRMKLKA